MKAKRQSSLKQNYSGIEWYCSSIALPLVEGPISKSHDYNFFFFQRIKIIGNSACLRILNSISFLFIAKQTFF